MLVKEKKFDFGFLKMNFCSKSQKRVFGENARSNASLVVQMYIFHLMFVCLGNGHLPYCYKEIHARSPIIVQQTPSMYSLLIPILSSAGQDFTPVSRTITFPLGAVLHSPSLYSYLMTLSWKRQSHSLSDTSLFLPRPQHNIFRRQLDVKMLCCLYCLMHS